MAETTQRPGARWWSLQVAVGLCLVLPPAWRLLGGSDRTVDRLFLVAGAGVLLNAAIWCGVSLAAGRRGWWHPVDRS